MTEEEQKRLQEIRRETRTRGPKSARPFPTPYLDVEFLLTLIDSQAAEIERLKEIHPADYLKRVNTLIKENQRLNAEIGRLKVLYEHECRVNTSVSKYRDSYKEEIQRLREALELAMTGLDDITYDTEGVHYEETAVIVLRKIKEILEKK